MSKVVVLRVFTDTGVDEAGYVKRCVYEKCSAHGVDVVTNDSRLTIILSGSVAVEFIPFLLLVRGLGVQMESYVREDTGHDGDTMVHEYESEVYPAAEERVTITTPDGQSKTWRVE
jgi:hypothetical protein